MADSSPVPEREEAGALLPAESMALTVALAQVLRGETPPPNTASMCVLALARVAGKFDYTKEMADG